MTDHTDNFPQRSEISISDDGPVALCRCWKSKKFPYCDGSHGDLKDSTLGPVIVRIAHEKD